MINNPDNAIDLDKRLLGTEKHQGTLLRVRDLLTNADLHTDDKGSEYYEIDAHELRKSLAALDEFLADVPDLEYSLKTAEEDKTIEISRHYRVYQAAKLLHEATQEKPE